MRYEKRTVIPRGLVVDSAHDKLYL